MINNSSKIHFWLPGIFDYKGGIQVYSTFFIRALEKILLNGDLDIFLKNDRPKNDELGFNPQTRFRFAGQWNVNPLHTLFFSAQVLLAALFNRPDLIICGHVNFSPLAARLSNLLDIPYWVIVHGIDVWELNDLAKINGLKTADRIISVSQYTANRLAREQNISSDKIMLLPNTFDDNKFNISQKPAHLLQRYRLSSNQPIILTVARLSGEDRYKGYDQIIQSLPAIHQKIPNTHYLLVGKGPDRKRIEQIINEFNVRGHVTLTGFIPDEELADYYNLCDVFALPSKGEGFGIVYLEAMACGKPCLGGNQDGALDALCHGELGALVNPNNIDEIAQTIIQLLQKSHPNSFLFQPEQLRQSVIERFGFEVFQQRLQRYLEEFLISSEKTFN